eukprot:1348155-Prymnesium_polylepis.1
MPNGALPLHFAAADGARDCVELLLNAYPEGARAKSDLGALPLHWAAIRGHRDCAHLLFKQHPEGATTADMEGKTPTALAHEKNHPKVLGVIDRDWARAKDEERRAEFEGARVVHMLSVRRSKHAAHSDSFDCDPRSSAANLKKVLEQDEGVK